VAPPARTKNPVLLQYATSQELKVDLRLSAPGVKWNMNHSYQSLNEGSNYSLGNKVLSSAADMFFYSNDLGLTLLVNGTSSRVFTGSGPTYTPPPDSYLTLTDNTTTHQLLLTDQRKKLRWRFYDMSASPSYLRGLLIEQSTNQLYTQGKSGFVYSYNSDGTLNQITTPTGQDYNIVFSYTGGIIMQVQIQDPLGNVLEQVNYTYYQNVTSPSSDIGSSGDLVQVQGSKQATGDPPGTMSIVRYTQYRYTTIPDTSNTSMLTAVFNHDAIQRIMTSTGLSSPAAILSQANSYGTPSIQSFATRSFTYYTTSYAPNTNNVNTVFMASENLTAEYGSTSGSSTIGGGITAGCLASETIGGCGSCGTAGSVTKNYYYMGPRWDTLGGDPPIHRLATGIPQTQYIVVEDTVDSAGNGAYRTIYGLGSARLLRRVIVQNPTSSPVFWCESWVFATATGSTSLPFRVAEHRFPSAHTGVTTNASVATFLNPNATGTGNDLATVNASSGKIKVFNYNSAGLRTDSWVKNGESGTPYYVSAKDYTDSVNPTVLTARWTYPTQTTTKGKYYDNLGRLRWKQDGEGYINYYAHHPVMGKRAYQVVDIDPASPPSGVTSGSSGNWESVSTDGASSNQPTRSSSLPTPLVLANQRNYDTQGKANQGVDPAGNQNYVVYGNLQKITFPYWNSTTGQCPVPIHVTNLNSAGQVSDQISVRANYTAISTSSGAPTGFSTQPSQSDYVSWTHYTYDPNTGRLLYTDNYVDSPSSGYGTLSTDFYRTINQYDTLGRKQYVVEVISGSVITSEIEQVTQNVYDVRNRVIQINKGVSPLGANMGPTTPPIRQCTPFHRPCTTTGASGTGMSRSRSNSSARVRRIIPELIITGPIAGTFAVSNRST
jgi:hypothetical protein